jgi:hypothetical protein
MTDDGLSGEIQRSCEAFEYKWNITDYDTLSQPIPAWISFLVINLVTVAARALIGRRLDSSAALKAIKEARLPKVVE